MNSIDDQLTAAELTVREREVLEYAALGMSAKEIAQNVGIAPRTIERHVENVRHKLRARNKTHMIAKAISLGLLHISRSRTASAGDEGAIKFKPKLAANE